MPLVQGIQEALLSKGVSQRAFIQRIPKDAGRWAIYRVLSGRSGDPRLSTFVLLCSALEVPPTDLLQLSGLWERGERTDTAADLRLREIFRSVQELEPVSRELATDVIEAVTRAFQDRGGTLPSD